MKTRKHPNIGQLVGVVDAGDGKIDGFLLSFIPGPTLSRIPRVTDCERNRWKNKIAGAVHFLHEQGLPWGDAKPDNIVINQRDDNPVLIDFEGGYS